MPDYLKIARGGLRQQRERQSAPESLEDVLKGQTVELYCDATGERFWIVADEADADRLMRLEGVGRGSVYSAGEVRRVLTINDAETVREVHRWKREFDCVVHEDG